MLSTLPRTFAFRAIAVVMALVLALPAFAAGIPPAVTDFARIVALIRNERPPQFTTTPYVRDQNYTKRRDNERQGWWTNAVKSDYAAATASNTQNEDNYALIASIASVPLLCLSVSWDTGSNTGYPIPGEGSFDVSGSGKTSPQGLSAVLNTGTGNVTSKLPILSFPVEGDLGVGVDLYHNSQDGTSPAWRTSYDSSITQGEDYVYVTMPDGLVVPYFRGTGYERPAGWFGLLEDVDGTHIKLTFKNQSEYIYTMPSGVTNYYLTAVKDRHGNTITVNRNGSHQITSVVAPDSRTVTYGYTSSVLTSITGPSSRVWGLSYTSGKLSTLTYPTVGGTTPTRTFTYDVRGNVTQETDAEGKAWTWTYNTDDTLATFKDPESATSTTVTYASGDTSILLPENETPWIHSYADGLLREVQDPDSYITYLDDYNANRLPLTITDPNGNATTLTYDSMGNMLTRTDPLSNTWTYTYNGTNDCTSEETPVVIGGGPSLQTNGWTWVSGNKTASTDPGGHVTTYTYDGTTSDLLEVEDPEGLTTTYTYNANGDIETVTDPAGIVLEFTYDTYGRLLTTTDGDANVTENVYDSWGRLVETINADASNVEYEYNKNSQLLTSTNELDKTSTNTYDDSGRLLTEANPLSDTQSYTYDDNWRTIEIENGRGKSRVYEYTERGDLYYILFADGCESYYSHDGNANVTALMEDNSYSIGYDFDERNLLTKIDYYSGTDTQFFYDEGGRRWKMTDSTGDTIWHLNIDNLVTELETPQQDLSYVYRDNHQREQMTEDGLGDTDYTYDAYGRLQTISNRFSEDTTLAYDTLGRLQRKTFDSGQYELYGYDERYRVTDIDLKNSSNSVLQAQDYVFDDASRVTGYTKAGVATTYGYDDADQLTSESRSGYSATYSYDANGNRLTRAISGGVSESYSYDDGDKLTGVTWSGGYKSFDYDAAGRMTMYNNNGSTRYFAYDYEGRMTGISGAYSASYTYNGLDTRVSKTENSVSNTFSRDGAGVTAPVLNDGSAAFTPGISESRSSVTTFIHSGMKNAEAQTETDQNLGPTRTYDAFGNLTASSGTWKGPFGYAGQFGYQEDATGLELLGHRYYDPSIGRFLTRDPIQDGRNWYVYCQNNPVGLADPQGRSPWRVILQLFVRIAQLINTGEMDEPFPPQPKITPGIEVPTGSAPPPPPPSGPYPPGTTPSPLDPTTVTPTAGTRLVVRFVRVLGFYAVVVIAVGALPEAVGPAILRARRMRGVMATLFMDPGDGDDAWSQEGVTE